MKLGKVALEKLKLPENSLETWRQKVKKNPEDVRKLLEGVHPVSAVWPISARQALDEYDQKQRDSFVSQKNERAKRQESRETENSAIAKRTLNWTAIAALVGCIAAFLAYKALAR